MFRFSGMMPGALFCAALASSACTTTDKGQLQSTAVVPSAAAEVTVKGKKDGNSKLKVEVKHLAKPENVSTGSHAYVVWVQPIQGEARPQNAGVLKVGDDLKGELETKVSFNEFNVFVTAEPSGAVTAPSGEKVLVSDKVYKSKD